MNIAFIHRDFPFSGAEQVTLDVANYLTQAGHRVMVLATRHCEQYYPHGVERRFQVELLPPGNMKRSRRVARAVRLFVERERVDVLVTYRELLYARWLKRTTGVRLVFELHNTPFYEFLDIADKKEERLASRLFYGCGVEWLLRRFYRSKYRRVYGWADAYGVLCPQYRDELIRLLHLSPDSHRVWVLPNAVTPPAHVTLRKQPTVVYVGRLSHRDKRVDRLLRIWQKAQPAMPGWTLKVVGDGKAARRLRAMAEEMRLPGVSFEGYSDNVQTYFDEASILCLTSSFEGWPMSMAEAQSNGVVPVVFDSFRGAEDLISTDDEGVLVPPYDEDAFARALSSLAASPARLSAMRGCVMAKAQTYTIGRSGQAWLNMLNHITTPQP